MTKGRTTVLPLQALCDSTKVIIKREALEKLYLR